MGQNDLFAVLLVVAAVFTIKLLMKLGARIRRAQELNPCDLGIFGTRYLIHGWMRRKILMHVILRERWYVACTKACPNTRNSWLMSVHQLPTSIRTRELLCTCLGICLLRVTLPRDCEHADDRE